MERGAPSNRADAAQHVLTGVNSNAFACDFSICAGRAASEDMAGGQGVAGSNPVVPTVVKKAGWLGESPGQRAFFHVRVDQLLI
jgi:hypothetical protein